MRQFNIYKTMMKYLTDENISLNAKGLLSIVFGTEIEKLYTDDKETIKEALLELKINKYVKYNTESGKLIVALFHILSGIRMIMNYKIFIE